LPTAHFYPPSPALPTRRKLSLAKTDISHFLVQSRQALDSPKSLVPCYKTTAWVNVMIFLNISPPPNEENFGNVDSKQSCFFSVEKWLTFLFKQNYHLVRGKWSNSQKIVTIIMTPGQKNNVVNDLPRYID
jgi:hypothetical protein